MKPVPIRNANCCFTKPANWDDAKDGACGNLAVRVQIFGANRVEYVSSWKPSAEELKVLNAGGIVILSIVGLQPPVSLYVEREPMPVVDLDNGHGAEPSS